jgi:hypothetical protein
MQAIEISGCNIYQSNAKTLLEKKRGRFIYPFSPLPK